MFSKLLNQVLLNHVRVSLSSSYGCVSQEFLYHPDVHTISQQKCRDCVAQHVWRNVSFNARVSTELSNDVRNALG